MSKAYLLVICFLVASFTGCMGEDDDDNSASPVGVWYYKENMFLELKENGTAVTPDETGTWVTSGDTITITFEDEVTFKFAVEGDRLWLQLEDDECGPFAPEAINEDDWDGRVSAQTTPSMCE